MIADEFEVTRIKYDTSFSDGQLKKTVKTNSKLLALFPDLKLTPLRQGLKETIAWFTEKYPEVRK